MAVWGMELCLLWVERSSDFSEQDIELAGGSVRFFLPTPSHEDFLIYMYWVFHLHPLNPQNGLGLLLLRNRKFVQTSSGKVLRRKLCFPVFSSFSHPNFRFCPCLDIFWFLGQLCGAAPALNSRCWLPSLGICLPHCRLSPSCSDCVCRAWLKVTWAQQRIWTWLSL